MAGSASDYLEAAVLNAAFRGITFPPVNNLYLGLHTAAPSEATSGNEVAGAWYVRQDMAVTAGTVSSAFSAPTPGASVITNSKNILFPAVTGSTTTVSHVAIYDAPTGGNMLFYSDLVAQKLLEVGDVFSLPVGGLSISAS